MESVREAGPGDLARCTELLRAARAEVLGRRGGPLLMASGADAAAIRPPDAPAEAVVGRWSAAGSSVLLAGLYDGVLVGMAAGTATGTVGLVECCYVEPAARQVGVGSALATRLLSWFAVRGCSGIDAWALPGDRDTKQLFEAVGFSARLLVLHRQLP